MKKILTLSLILGFIGNYSFASDYDSSELPVKISLAQPINLVLENNMKFGSVTPHPLEENTIYLRPDGYTYSNQSEIPTPTDSEPGIISIKGEPNSTVSIYPSTSSVVLTGTGTSINVNNFNILYNGEIINIGSGDTANILIGSSGSEEISVGGTMHLNAAQASGSYSGSITINVDY